MIKNNESIEPQVMNYETRRNIAAGLLLGIALTGVAGVGKVVYDVANMQPSAEQIYDNIVNSDGSR